MVPEDVRQLLLENFPDATINVTGEGENYSVEVISPEFENTSKFNRQKKILSCVKEQITSGEIHAFSVQAYAQDEWNDNANSLTVL